LLGALAGSIFWEQLLGALAGSSCWEQLLGAVAGSSCWEQLTSITDKVVMTKSCSSLMCFLVKKLWSSIISTYQSGYFF
jgi:hypothetical protein